MNKENDKKILIMEATYRLLGQKPYHEIKMEEIAVEAKVGKGTIYRYFSDKDDLMLSLGEYGREYLSEKFILVAADGKKISDKLYNCAVLHHNTVIESGAILRIISEELQIFHKLKGENKKILLKHTLESAVEKILIAAQNSEEIKADLDFDFLARLFCGMVRNLSFSAKMENKKMPDFKKAIEFFLNNLKHNNN